MSFQCVECVITEIYLLLVARNLLKYILLLFIFLVLGHIALLVAIQGRIQDFKLGGAHLKKLRRAEGGAKIVGVFRVKNHDFTPKNHIFPILGGARDPSSYFLHKFISLAHLGYLI